MSAPRDWKLDIGVATVILALATIIAAIISNFDKITSGPISDSGSETTKTSTIESPTEELGSGENPNPTSENGTTDTSTIDPPSEEIKTIETSNIQSSDESENVIFTHKYGQIELTDNHSGVAYIYKSLLDEMPIGTITKNNQPSAGWQISLFKGTESFGIYLFSETHTPPIERCLVQYNVLGNCEIIFSNTPNYFYNDSGDLQIEFSYNNIPFDLRESEAIDVSYVLS